MSISRPHQRSSLPSLPTSGWSVFISIEGLTFLLSVILCSFLAIVVLNTKLNFTQELRHILVMVGEVITIFAWISLALYLWYKNKYHFYKILGSVSLVAGPVFLMILLTETGYSELFFWWNIISWAWITVHFSLKKCTNLDRWEKFLISISIVWTIIGSFFTIGSIPFLPFAKTAANRLHGINILMDLRILIALLILTTITGTAVYGALRQKRPTLKKIIPWILPTPRQKGILAAALFPFIQILNILLLVLNTLIEFLYKGIQLLRFYFSEIGIQFGNLIKKIVFQFQTWIETIRAIAIFTIFIIISYLLIVVTPYSYSYMSAVTWREQIILLMQLAIFTAALSICVWIIVALFVRRRYKEVGELTIMSLVWILMAFLLSGAIVYGLYFIGLEIQGFERIGIYTIALLLLIAYGIFRTFSQKKKHTP